MTKEKLKFQEQEVKEKDNFFKKQFEDLEVDEKAKIDIVQEEVSTQNKTLAQLKVAITKNDIDLEDMKLEMDVGS